MAWRATLVWLGRFDSNACCKRSLSQNDAYHNICMVKFLGNILKRCNSIYCLLQIHANLYWFFFTRSSLKLAYTKHHPENVPSESSQSTPLVILHGLFASKNSWQSLSKRFANELGTQVNLNLYAFAYSSECFFSSEPDIHQIPLHIMRDRPY